MYRGLRVWNGRSRQQKLSIRGKGIRLSYSGSETHKKNGSNPLDSCPCYYWCGPKVGKLSFSGYESDYVSPDGIGPVAISLLLSAQGGLLNTKTPKPESQNLNPQPPPRIPKPQTLSPKFQVPACNFVCPNADGSMPPDARPVSNLIEPGPGIRFVK